MKKRGTLSCQWEDGGRGASYTCLVVEDPSSTNKVRYVMHRFDVATWPEETTERVMKSYAALVERNSSSPAWSGALRVLNSARQSHYFNIVGEYAKHGSFASFLSKCISDGARPRRVGSIAAGFSRWIPRLATSLHTMHEAGSVHGDVSFASLFINNHDGGVVTGEDPDIGDLDALMMGNPVPFPHATKFQFGLDRKRKRPTSTSTNNAADNSFVSNTVEPIHDAILSLMKLGGPVKPPELNFSPSENNNSQNNQNDSTSSISSTLINFFTPAVDVYIFAYTIGSIAIALRMFLHGTSSEIENCNAEGVLRVASYCSNSRFKHLLLQMVSADPNQRPTMKKVLKELSEIDFKTLFVERYDEEGEGEGEREEEEEDKFEIEKQHTPTKKMQEAQAQEHHHQTKNTPPDSPVFEATDNNNNNNSRRTIAEARQKQRLLQQENQQQQQQQQPISSTNESTTSTNNSNANKNKQQDDSWLQGAEQRLQQLEDFHHDQQHEQEKEEPEKKEEKHHARKQQQHQHHVDPSSASGVAAAPHDSALNRTPPPPPSSVQELHSKNKKQQQQQQQQTKKSTSVGESSRSPNENNSNNNKRGIHPLNQQQQQHVQQGQHQRQHQQVGGTSPIPSTSNRLSRSPDPTPTNYPIVHNNQQQQQRMPPPAGGNIKSPINNRAAHQQGKKITCAADLRVLKKQERMAALARHEMEVEQRREQFLAQRAERQRKQEEESKIQLERQKLHNQHLKHIKVAKRGIVEAVLENQKKHPQHHAHHPHPHPHHNAVSGGSNNVAAASASAVTAGSNNNQNDVLAESHDEVEIYVKRSGVVMRCDDATGFVPMTEEETKSPERAPLLAARRAAAKQQQLDHEQEENLLGATSSSSMSSSSQHHINTNNLGATGKVKHSHFHPQLGGNPNEFGMEIENSSLNNTGDSSSSNVIISPSGTQNDNNIPVVVSAMTTMQASSNEIPKLHLPEGRPRPPPPIRQQDQEQQQEEEEEEIIIGGNNNNQEDKSRGGAGNNLELVEETSQSSQQRSPPNQNQKQNNKNSPPSKTSQQQPKQQYDVELMASLRSLLGSEAMSVLMTEVEVFSQAPSHVRCHPRANAVFATRIRAVVNDSNNNNNNNSNNVAVFPRLSQAFGVDSEEEGFLALLVLLGQLLSSGGGGAVASL